MIDVFDRDAGIGLVGADQVDAVYGVAGLADQDQPVKSGFTHRGMEHLRPVGFFDDLKDDVVAFDGGDAKTIGGAAVGQTDGLALVGVGVADRAVHQVALALARRAGDVGVLRLHFAGDHGLGALDRMGQVFQATVALADPR